MSVHEGLRLSEMSITDRMRHHLAPKGTANVSRLQMDNPFVNHDFVLKCIDELERMPLRAELGQPPTALEQLAYMLLCDSAYIEPRNKTNA